MATKEANQTEIKLDKFQEDAINLIKEGKSVLVCAPTGAGKTLIASEAIKEAINNKKKVFYTTPLKALSNQKFLDFTNEYGEENVGIITGDTSKNREAPIVVMTTEIYRNMLYGTHFGSVDPFLQDLKYVIFDEFHYMNSQDRGTVWEESVIYSPKSVQIVGLSATINNPQEIIQWITEIHSECHLVETQNRPVPLYHYYFKDEQLAPLLLQTGKLNPKLKERNDNRFGGKKGKFNKRGGANNKPATSDMIVSELAKKDMLPAIFFVFSRKGCDSSAKECEKLNLLDNAESKELNKLIDEAIKANPRLDKSSQLSLLRKGIATHHAGLLPSWKTLVEELFNKGLVKVVFSTETLAAGINMPARTTVITSISKRGDDGHRILRPSEFLQMSGRAGRRGMDKAGYVITVKNNYQTAGEVAVLANSKPEDIESHFNASYEMVLNLLQNHSIEEAKELIQKSFGQSLANQDLKPLSEELKVLEDRIVDAQSPLCPGDLGDLNHYRELQEKLDVTRKKKKDLEKKMDSGVIELEEALQILTLEAQNYPCNGCPKQKPCSKQMSNIRRYKKQTKEINSLIENKKSIYWEKFQDFVSLLKEKGYLDDNSKPTELGKTCSSLRSENSLLITEMLQVDIFATLSPAEFASAIAGIVTDSHRAKDSVFVHSSRNVFDAFERMHAVARKVIQSQRKYRITKPAEINAAFAPLVEEWAKGDIEWDELMSSTSMDDGDVLRGLRRVTDLLKQITHAPNVDPQVSKLAQEAVELLEREPVLELS